MEGRFLFDLRRLKNSSPALRGPNTPDRFALILYKMDTFCDLPFSFLYTKSHLKRRLLYKERICSQMEQILSLYSRVDHFSEDGGGRVCVWGVGGVWIVGIHF